MERHNVLILSNLDTEEHLEIGISLISDALLRQGGRGVTKKRGGCVLARLDVSCGAMHPWRDFKLKIIYKTLKKKKTL